MKLKDELEAGLCKLFLGRQIVCQREICGNCCKDK